MHVCRHTSSALPHINLLLSVLHRVNDCDQKLVLLNGDALQLTALREMGLLIRRMLKRRRRGPFTLVLSVYLEAVYDSSAEWSTGQHMTSAACGPKVLDTTTKLHRSPSWSDVGHDIRNILRLRLALLP